MYTNLIVALVFVGVYYLLTVVFALPFSMVLLVYGAGLAVCCVIFRAGLFAGLANIFYSRGNRTKAREYFKKSFAHRSKNPLTYLNYAVLVLHDGDGPEALKYAKKALEFKSDLLVEKNCYLTISSALWVMGDIDEAVKTLEGMTERYEYVNVYVLSTLAYLYILQGKLEQAEETTQKALADSPESGAAWDNMGQIYLKRNMIDEAEEAFKKAVSFKDGLVDSLYFLGVIYEIRNDKEKAEEYFVRAYKCKITSLNTVTKDQVEEKYKQYTSYIPAQD